MHKSLFSVFCKEPYRIFFPLGIVAGAVGASHWLFFALGWIKSYSTLFHSAIQMQAYMACFVIGFLLTSMPRFAQADFTSAKEFLVFLFLVFGILGFQIFGFWSLANLCFIGLLAALARFAFVRFRKKETLDPPLEFVWIPIAIFHGMVGSLIMIFVQFGWASPWLLAAGKPMVEQGFLLSVVMGVGGFLGPRLMGFYQLIKPSEISRKEREFQIPGPRIQIHLIAGVLLFCSFWLEGLGYRAWAYGLRALLVTSEFLWTGSITHFPKVSDFFAKLLWISFWMVVIGYWMVVIFPLYRTIMLHLVFIGGFSLMTFSVATMVTLSHAGEAVKLHHPLLVLWIVAIGLGCALILRVLAVFFPSFYFNVLGVASAFWLLAGVSWLCFVTPRILKIPDPGEFEQSHEEAKKRILDPGKTC